MIDSVLNLLFRCSHRRLTRPVTPVSKAGVPQGPTYVVCLDCGKQFAYNFQEMRIGRALESSLEQGVLPPDMPQPRARKVKFALWASLPLAVFLGAALKGRKPQNGPRQDTKPKRGGS
jgi:hypothetical protein